MAITSVGTTQSYTAAGGYAFTAPVSGVYEFKIAGGKGGNSGKAGGAGGVVVGYKYLAKGTTVYVYVGGAGSNGSDDTNAAGGAGGGGTGSGGGGGGGATMVSTGNGWIYNHGERDSRILLVAGGGGGGSSAGAGGAGGGATGSANGANGGTATNEFFYVSQATPTAPGYATNLYCVGTYPINSAAGWGKGFSPHPGPHTSSGGTSQIYLPRTGGGGGGYYGGSSAGWGGGQGGSAYLGGMPALSWGGKSYSAAYCAGANNGNGYATITLKDVVSRLNYNGTNVKAVTYNGTALTQVNYNGVSVFGS